jgi:hypothetical protein
MAFCSGGDLSVYIKKRGKLPTLDYRPFPGAEPIYWPHPKEGGLDGTVARCFLGQLGKTTSSNMRHHFVILRLNLRSAEALKFLRERNLIHRDIKPQVRWIAIVPVCRCGLVLTLYLCFPLQEPPASSSNRSAVCGWTSAWHPNPQSSRLRICAVSSLH